MTSPGSLAQPPVHLRSVAGEAASELTGRILVYFGDRDAHEVSADLMSITGVEGAAFSSDHKNAAIFKQETADSSLLIFERVRVAVVDADPDQAAIVTAAQEELGLAVEPERYVYAATETFTGPDPVRDRLRQMQGIIRDLLGEADAGDEDEEGPTAAVTALAAPSPSAEEPEVTWALEALGITPDSPLGDGVRVAVLDTGLDLNHPDLTQSVQAFDSFIEDEDAHDVVGHGTHCAGIVCGPVTPSSGPRYGVAPGVQLLVGKVLDRNGRGVMADVIGGIDWAADLGARVVSMSLSVRTVPGMGYSVAFENMARRLAQGPDGMVLVAAAGNDSKRRHGLVAPVGHPASAPTVVAVGAVDRRFKVANFSNGSYGPAVGQVDIAAPGVQVHSAYPGPNGPYALLTGTSMAAPHVAGVLAQMIERRPQALVSELVTELGQRAWRLPDSSLSVGAGLVQGLDQ